jgi:Ca2+-binding EF-hand superfamily protein
MVAPAGFIALRQNIEDEMERRTMAGDDLMHAALKAEGAQLSGEGKPSMEVLCQRLGMPMARMEWLHQLFESYLQSDEEGAPIVVCNYPSDSGILSKDQMRSLLSEMNPDLTEPEFEARFNRIDEDGSGEIEFDEFVNWVCEDEVDVVGFSGGEKRSFQELADFFGEPVEIINYVHTCFKDQFPEGESDGYPSNPGALSQKDIRFLVSVITPEVEDDEFQEQFDIVANGKESLQFDEFLDVIAFDCLEDEVRKKYGNPTSPNWTRQSSEQAP